MGEAIEGYGLKSIQREVLRDRVYDELRAALVCGRVAPGQRVTIRALADQLGTSPTPVREALTRLHAERVIELNPNGSAVIPVLTRERFEHISEIRSALEGLAAEQAARRMCPQEVEELEQIVQRMLALIDRGALDEYLELHRDFHFRIYRCAGNPLLVAMIEGLWTQCGPALTYVVPDYVLQRSGSRQHRLAVDALRRGDAIASRKAITRDIYDAAKYIKGLADHSGEIRRRKAA